MTSLDYACVIVALFVATLIVVVMQRTDGDRAINRHDSSIVQWLRRLTFISTAVVLLLSMRYSIMTGDWQVSWILVVGSSALILFVNAVALHLRTPPNPGSKLRHHAMRVDRSKLRPANFRDRHRES